MANRKWRITIISEDGEKQVKEYEDIPMIQQDISEWLIHDQMIIIEKNPLAEGLDEKY